MASYELLLGDATRVPLAGAMTVGRSPACTVVLDDPTVSRRHARISLGDDGEPLLEDPGSSFGTFVDGARVTGPTRLRDGARIRLGESELRVVRRRRADEADHTIVVPAGTGRAGGRGPQVRAGYALKRLEAAEGNRRWVLRDLAQGTVRRLADVDAELFERLDGTHDTAELVAYAEQRFGPEGPALLARLLADLGDRGLLVGVAASRAPAPARSRLLRARALTLPRAGEAIDALYRRGAWRLVTRPAVVGIAALSLAGIAAFVGLVAARYGTPFVVARKVGLGALAFLLGRLAIVAVHELAHGLVLASYGRRIERAGFKLVLIFPYAFVDTSQAWLEPRRRRIAVSAAGPAADLALGAVFALGCLAAPAGATRDVLFQLALAAYVGAWFNINPFLDRDGYQILVDVLREPNLRRRAREQFARRLAGQRDAGDSRLLARYSVLALAWSVVAVGFAVAMTLRYRTTLAAVAGADWLAWLALGAVWVIVLVPTAALLVSPLRARRARA
ncbi:MAG TPA: FHA domain-containing protein [Solirubrobacteraceae bacterium]|nr:FHA domain-containing protein [Solirubrobacteraceae bacterium]